ncbi:hypothetical protein TBLA_0F01990 [Henningerozyma blattae CBS 6284]|uniref:Impact N-terminal domain-containing protein n=1 Tax=Henningerozyma blattae (strain ATCC 34711 / CBS 6284 / DSM 70876 / NBRC 10599 / NRRL Y-10934 / UCD 77-7) TaxID=1071380 RepID=I2H5T9_HENB6|nr:hypothetical protein TBLA_0F01990 [Tetrapisispora blattae CBS 6284]CCH61741.1 hypothetical protein TBLA_0F01990 [Tetrapisispora blattae CBS 6284]
MIWIVGEEVIDRKSRFVARCHSLEHEKDIPTLLTELVNSNKKISKATHPHILAWRLQNKNGNIQQGSQDGGEKGGGPVLLSLLEKNNLTGILLVVTRWHGGTQLGSARFRDISKAALNVLKLGKYI